jgi:GNAT superfamily N-acetyltransferase
VVLDRETAMAKFNQQVRRSIAGDGSGAVGQRVGPVVRWTAPGGPDWAGVAWSDLDAATADQVIADQIAFYAARSESFEWKTYSYDQPADLGERLMAAGFSAGDPESLMVAEAAEAALAAGTAPRAPEAADAPPGSAELPLPPGVRLVQVTDEAGIALLIDVGDQVFGTDHARLRAALTARLRDAPETVAMVLAMAGDEPVSSARIEFAPGTEFAGLWGGGTRPQWRGRGIYRALVAYRARLAVARGYRYLMVDASPQSRPILERLGFSCLALTTPYVWSPDP